MLGRPRVVSLGAGERAAPEQSGEGGWAAGCLAGGAGNEPLRSAGVIVGLLRALMGRDPKPGRSVRRICRQCAESGDGPAPSDGPGVGLGLAGSSPPRVVRRRHPGRKCRSSTVAAGCPCWGGRGARAVRATVRLHPSNGWRVWRIDLEEWCTSFDGFHHRHGAAVRGAGEWGPPRIARPRGMRSAPQCRNGR